MTKLKKGSVISLKIEDLAYGGKGISKITTQDGGLIVFTPNTIPGQEIKGRIFKKRKKFIECKLIEVTEKSELEVKQPYQAISGAPFLNLPIEKQREYKERNTLDLYQRLGKIDQINTYYDEFIESPSIFHYRNKMEYAFSQIGYDIENNEVLDDVFVLGSKRRGTWWIVESLQKDSGIFDADFENKLHEIETYLKETGLPAWHPPKKIGFYRYLTVRKSYTNNQLIINLTTSASHLDEFDATSFVNKLKTLFGERLAGILHTVNDSLGERATSDDNSYEVLFGENRIEEKLLDLNFDVSMQSFFQTNPKSAEKLYQKVLDYVLLDTTYGKDDIVMDLFCGTGTIGQLISKHTDCQVVGVDIIEEAIENAKVNGQKNGIKSAKFYAADVGKFLKQYPEYEGKIKTVVLDPPRGGIAPKTVEKVVNLNADRVVYVSCNPSTQVRDLETFFKADYELKKISLVDQFPHTAHIESIVLLEKIKK